MEEMTLANCPAFFAIIFICNAFPSVPDNRGREFLFAFGDNYGPDSELEIFITTDEDNVDVNVSLPLNNTIQTQRLAVDRTNIGRVAYPETVRMSGLGIENKAILIQSSADVVVYATNKASASVDAFLVLPTDIIGTLYFVASYPGFLQIKDEPDRGPQAAIVSVHDNTTISITLPGTRNVGNWFTYNNVNYTDGDTLNISLSKYETFQLQVKDDLTGTRVVSNNPIAVVSGNKRTYVPSTAGKTSSDHLEEMIPPVNTWGRTFITVPLTERTGGDTFRILASKDSTLVNITSTKNATTTTLAMNAGDYEELDVESDDHLYIVSDESVFVYQFSKMKDVDGANSDPMMVYLPPKEQFDNRYSFVTVEAADKAKQYNNFVNIVIKRPVIDGLRFDGVPIITFDYTMVTNSTRWRNVSYYEKNWTTVAGTEYSANTLFVPHGSHVLSHEDPTVSFGALMYGQVQHEAYGYPAGSRFASIGDYCVQNATTMTPGDGIDNDCDNAVDEELYDGRDNDGDGLIDEDVAFVVVVTTTTTEPTTTTTPRTATAAPTTAATTTPATTPATTTTPVVTSLKVTPTEEQPSTSSAPTTVHITSTVEHTTTTVAPPGAGQQGADDQTTIGTTLPPDESDNTGVIVGVTVPLLILAIAGGLLLAFFLVKRRRKKKEELLALKEAGPDGGEASPDDADNDASSVENNNAGSRADLSGNDPNEQHSGQDGQEPDRSNADTASNDQPSRPSSSTSLLRSSRIAPAPV